MALFMNADKVLASLSRRKREEDPLTILSDVLQREQQKTQQTNTSAHTEKVAETTP